MKESELLGKLMPGHPDILPIIQKIREKYQIPEVRPEDDIDEILLTRDDIDWEAVRQDIETQVQSVQLFEDQAATYIQGIRKLQTVSLDFPELENCPEEVKEQLKKLFSALINFFTPMLALIDERAYKPLTEMVFEYLLTGKTRDVPEDWFAKVFTMTVLGNTSVVAMAGEAADPKVIAEQFKAEFTKTFGSNRPKITETYLDTAEYLAMKLQGNSYKRLVERYEEKYPDQFPKNKSSKSYRETIKKQTAMMKKRIQRLQDVLGTLGRDKN